jgi:hypothetical protein
MGEGSRFSTGSLGLGIPVTSSRSRARLSVKSPYFRQATPQKPHKSGVTSPLGAFHQLPEEVLPHAAHAGGRFCDSALTTESSSSFVTNGCRESEGLRANVPLASRARRTLFSAPRHLLQIKNWRRLAMKHLITYLLNSPK